MAACSSLQVVLRVEVAVHKDDGVSSCEVQADSPCKQQSTQRLKNSEHVQQCYLHTYLLIQLQELRHTKRNELWQEIMFVSSLSHSAYKTAACHPAAALISEICSMNTGCRLKRCSSLTVDLSHLMTPLSTNLPQRCLQQAISLAAPLTLKRKKSVFQYSASLIH